MGKYILEIMARKVGIIVIKTTSLLIILFLRWRVSTTGSNVTGFIHRRYFSKYKKLKKSKSEYVGSRRRSQGIERRPESVRGIR